MISWFFNYCILRAMFADNSSPTNGHLTKKAEPPPTRDVNRDSGTDSANGGWLQRLVRPRCVNLHKTIRQKSPPKNLSATLARQLPNRRSCNCSNLPQTSAPQNPNHRNLSPRKNTKISK